MTPIRFDFFKTTLRKKMKLWKKIILVLLLLIVGFAIFSPARMHSRIVGISMTPTIEDGDIAILERRLSDPIIGGIYTVSGLVVFNKGKVVPTNLIKRVIAGPGDRLVFHVATGEWLSINGQKVIIERSMTYPDAVLTSMESKTYGEKIRLTAGINKFLNTPVYQMKIDNPNATPSRAAFAKTIVNLPYLKTREDKNGLMEVRVPKDHYFLMSDNRAGNIDSRFFGPVHKSFIDKKVLKIRKAKHRDAHKRSNV